MIFNIEAACASFIGNDNNKNEDNFFFNKRRLPINNQGVKTPLFWSGNTLQPPLFAVFDGMGGETNGGIASNKASEMFSEEFKKLDEIAMSGKEYMILACERANVEISNFSEAAQIGTMGTTVAAVYFAQDEVVSCNVGDSKIFRIRNNQMLQISEDHTDEKIMTAMGVKKKPVLLQYLGVPDTEMEIQPFITKGEACSGDVFVLCSDGVTDIITVESMYEIIIRNNSYDAVSKILAEVSRNDGADNATVIVIRIL